MKIYQKINKSSQTGYAVELSEAIAYGMLDRAERKIKHNKKLKLKRALQTIGNIAVKTAKLSPNIAMVLVGSLLGLTLGSYIFEGASGVYETIEAFRWMIV